MGMSSHDMGGLMLSPDESTDSDDSDRNELARDLRATDSPASDSDCSAVKRHVAAIKGGKSKVGDGQSSGASSTRTKYLQHFRKEMESHTNGHAVLGMERFVKFIAVLIINMAIGIPFMFNMYGATLNNYGNVMEVQGVAMRSARAFAEAIRDVALINDGVT